jgi:hypothetical protein
MVRSSDIVAKENTAQWEYEYNKADSSDRKPMNRLRNNLEDWTEKKAIKVDPVYSEYLSERGIKSQGSDATRMQHSAGK